MNRRVFILASAGFIALGQGATAAPAEEQVARAISGQGFRITSRKRTFLGRVRFTAVRGNVEREVVVDPSSGEVLRDYSRTETRSVGKDTSRSSSSGGGEPGGGESGGGEPGGGEPGGGEPGGGEPGGGEPGGERGGEPGGERGGEPSRSEPPR